MIRWRRISGAAAIGLALCISGISGFADSERMDFADGLFHRGMEDLALKEYLALLRDEPENEHRDRLLYQVGECYRNIGNSAAAEAYYRRLAGLRSGSEFGARAAFRLGERALEQQQPAEALALFDSAAVAPGAPPDLVEAAALLRARSLTRSGRVAEGEAAFLALLEKYPDSPFAAAAAFEAAELLRAAGGREAQEEALYRRVTLLREGEDAAAEAWLRIADLSFRAGRHGDAADAADSLLRRFPESSQADAARRLAAWSYLRVNRWTDATALAEKALAEKADEEWLYLLANARRQLKNSAGALSAYDQLLASFPTGNYVESAAYEAALVAFQTGDAAGTIRRGADLKPKGDLRSEVDWLLAEAYVAAGETESAIQRYRSLMGMQPPSSRAPDAAFRLGLILQERSAWLEAAEAFRLSADRSSVGDLAVRARHSVAYCLTQGQRPAEALIEWSRLLRDHPDHALAEDTHFRKAMCELQLDRSEAASESLRLFLDRWPKSIHQAEARYWRGVLLERAGEKEAAEREYRAGTQAAPREELDIQLRFRWGLMLRALDRPDEAADVLQGLWGRPGESNWTPPLLMWLADRQLKRERIVEAEQVAGKLIRMSEAEAPGEVSFGWYVIGRVRSARKEIDGALEAFDRSAAAPVRLRESIDAACALANCASNWAAPPRPGRALKRWRIAPPGRRISIFAFGPSSGWAAPRKRRKTPRRRSAISRPWRFCLTIRCIPPVP
ncbi:MAG: tetratricopeptide repeat protein [Kiritimatiellia bacterium]|nr:tetratricopeptide repeat protein [Kiritimatiellia bacterium]